jgi:DeoR family glycerol-3-phosphate regulon repressor
MTIRADRCGTGGLFGKVAKRREQILGLVQRHRTVHVAELSAALGVSPQTVRRDINFLAAAGTVRRRHGGAALADPHSNLPYDERRIINVEAKRAIASAAAAMIPSGATVFISVGTTPAMVAQALRGHQRLTVITNNLHAAMALAHDRSNRIILPGGEVRLPDCDLLGDHVVQFFAEYRAEFAVFGVGGIAEDGGLLDFHRAEVEVRQQMRKNSRTSVLVADRMKFGRAAPAVGGNVREVDRIVVDGPADGRFAHLMEAAQDRLVCAGETG